MIVLHLVMIRSSGSMRRWMLIVIGLLLINNKLLWIKSNPGPLNTSIVNLCWWTRRDLISVVDQTTGIIIMLVNSWEFWPQHYVKCTFPDAADGAECEIYAAADSGQLPLLLVLWYLLNGLQPAIQTNPSNWHCPYLRTVYRVSIECWNWCCD